MIPSRKYYVYIMTNKNKSVLYIGVTGNLRKRIYEHKKDRFGNSFSRKYNLFHLLPFEEYDNPNIAIAREKQLKMWNKQWKERLINKNNVGWKDLSNDWEL
jgi:putative endonuclease